MDLIQGRFVSRPRNKSGWAKYQAQEPGDEGQPDIKRPPDHDIIDLDRDDFPEYPDGPGAPPFTGEDVEDTEEPSREHHRTNPNVDMFLRL